VRYALALCLLGLASCTALGKGQVEHLATARVTPDFETYQLHRVGLMPLAGRELQDEQAEMLQNALFTEFSHQTPYEIVPLDPQDLEEVVQIESYRRGRYESQMVIDLARRFRLDGVLIGTVIDYQYYSPQRLSLQVDLVASETGAAIWSGSVSLDGTSERVHRAVEAYFEASESVKTADGKGWEIALLSPRLFAQFAAWQISKML